MTIGEAMGVRQSTYTLLPGQWQQVVDRNESRLAWLAVSSFPGARIALNQGQTTPDIPNFSEFDGRTQYMTASDAALPLGAVDFSFSLWYQISCRQPVATYVPLFSWGDNTTPQTGVQLQAFVFYQNSLVNVVNPFTAVFGLTPLQSPLDEWVNFVCTGDIATGNVVNYVNGRPTSDTSAAWNILPSAVYVASNPTIQPTDFLRCRVANIRVFSTVLTAAQAGTIFDAGPFSFTDGVTGGLVGWWNPPDYDGVAIRDMTVAHADGTLINGPGVLAQTKDVGAMVQGLAADPLASVTWHEQGELVWQPWQARYDGSILDPAWCTITVYEWFGSPGLGPVYTPDKTKFDAVTMPRRGPVTTPVQKQTNVCQWMAELIQRIKRGL